MFRGKLAAVCCVLAWACLHSSPVESQSAIRQGDEFQVNTHTTNNQFAPAIAADADGDFVVTWTSDGQNHYSRGVFGTRFNSSGQKLASEFQVNLYQPSVQHFTDVASESNGDFVIVWHSLSQDGSPYGVIARRFDSAGTGIGGEFQVNTFTTSYQVYPKIASDSDGDFVVTWQSLGQDAGFYGVFAQRFNSSGAFLGAEFRVNSFTPANQQNPEVALDADGDFVIVWESFNENVGFGYDVFAKRFNSAGVLQATQFQVNTYSFNNQYEPAVAVRANGDFAVVWQSQGQDGHYLGIFLRRFTSAGVAQGIEFQVNVVTVNQQRHPDVARDGDGDFVVVWESLPQDGDELAVIGRRFTASGAPQPPFQVNKYTYDDQARPVAAFDNDNDFIVAWQSDLQDPGAGVFAQRFSVPPLATLDIDGNGIIEPLGDGLLNLRHRFGFSGSSLTTGAVSGTCTRCAAAEITAYLNGLGLVLDIDNNGALDPLTDGLLVLRFMFGFTGTTLTNGAVAGNCVTRCDPMTILTYLQTLD
jgi:hypothetical protein